MTRRFCRGVVLITGLVLALVSARPTEAGIVTVNFSGTVTSIDDPSGDISGTNLGDSFSGTLVYNSSTARWISWCKSRTLHFPAEWHEPICRCWELR